MAAGVGVVWAAWRYAAKGTDPKAAGQLAGKLVGKISIYLALIGPAFSAMNYLAELHLPDTAQTVTVFPKAEKVTAATLRTAEVPADCRLPAQRLVDGKTTQGSPGGGSINTGPEKVGFADFAGLGYKQALTEYGCGAGGVGWPETLVLIGAGGKLLSSFGLSQLAAVEHSNVTKVSVSGNAAGVAWDSYEGAGFEMVHHQAQVTYSNGQLVVTNHVATYSPEAVADDVLSASYGNNRSMLKDPHVLTDAMWSNLVAAHHDHTVTLSQNSYGSGCPITNSTAECDLDVSSADRPGVYTGSMELTKTPGTAYGWTVTDLTLP